MADLRLVDFFPIREGASDIENPDEPREEVLRIAAKELPSSVINFKKQTGCDLGKAQVGFNSWGDLLAKVDGLTFCWDAMGDRWERMG